MAKDKKDQQVRISTRIYNKLRDLKKITGLPIRTQLNQGMMLYIEVQSRRDKK